MLNVKSFVPWENILFKIFEAGTVPNFIHYFYNVYTFCNAELVGFVCPYMKLVYL